MLHTLITAGIKIPQGNSPTIISIDLMTDLNYSVTDMREVLDVHLK